MADLKFSRSGNDVFQVVSSGLTVPIHRKKPELIDNSESSDVEHCPADAQTRRSKTTFRITAVWIPEK